MQQFQSRKAGSGMEREGNRYIRENKNLSYNSAIEQAYLYLLVHVNILNYDYNTSH